MTFTRFHVPEAAPGAHLVLPEHSARHARDVLRLRPGTLVHVFDGRGNEFQGRLDSVTRQGVTVHLAGAVAPRPEPPLPLVLALSPLKGDRMELVIQKATELGVAEIRPVVTARTDAVARPALSGSRQERWDKVAAAAAEQCGRAVVPSVAQTTTLASFLEQPFQGRRLLLYEQPGQPALPRNEPAPSAALLLIGPAGGWESHEIDSTRNAGFAPISLGPRILRAETAAIAAVSVLQWLWGDLA